MADAEEEKGSSKSLAGMFSVAWGLARIFLGGLLSMLLAGAVAGIVFAIVGYLFGSYILAGLTTLIAAAGSQAITWTGAIFNFFVEHLITTSKLGTLASRRIVGSRLGGAPEAVRDRTCGAVLDPPRVPADRRGSPSRGRAGRLVLAFADGDERAAGHKRQRAKRRFESDQ